MFLHIHIVNTLGLKCSNSIENQIKGARRGRDLGAVRVWLGRGPTCLSLELWWCWARTSLMRQWWSRWSGRLSWMWHHSHLWSIISKIREILGEESRHVAPRRHQLHVCVPPPPPPQKKKKKKKKSNSGDGPGREIVWTKSKEGKKGAGQMGEELPWCVTELPICIWLIVPLQDHNLFSIDLCSIFH